MKRVVVVCLSFALLLVMVAGCEAAEQSATGAPTASQAVAVTGGITDTSNLREAVMKNAETANDYKWPQMIIFTTPNSGQVYSNLLGLSAVLERSIGLRTRVITNDIQPARAAMLRDRQVNVDGDTLGAYTYNLEATAGAVGPDNGPFPIRIGYVATVACRGYVVRADNPIQTIYDIKPGVRIAMPPQPGIQQKNLALLAWLDIDPSEAELIYFGNFDETLQAVADGRCDIVNTGFSGAPIMQLANNPRGIRVLDLPYETDPEGYARWLAANPVESIGLCDASSTSIPEAIGTNAIYQVFFHYWLADADEEFVYQLTRWFAENHDNFKDQEITLQTMTIENFRYALDFTPFPVHDGAIRYMKEIGAWSERDDARQVRNVERVNRYIAAWGEAKAGAVQQGITISATNSQWVDFWEDYKKELNLPRFEVSYD